MGYLFLSLTVIFSVMTFLTSGVDSCGSERVCPEDYSCVDNICRKCLKCDLMFRKGNFCVSDFNECGECLDGYEEISITNNAFIKKPCKPIRKKVKFKECTSEKSCPPDNYCDKEHCIKCFDCTLMNRSPPANNCAKDLTGCGGCLKGFSEVAVTTDTNYKPCDMVTMDVLLSKTDFQLFLAFLGAVVFTIIILGIAVIKYGKESTLSKSLSHCSIYPSAPPLDSMDSPEFIRKFTGVEHSVLKCMKEQSQQAKVFKQPDAPYYSEESEARPSQLSPQDRHQPEEVSFQGFLLNFGINADDPTVEQPDEVSIEVEEAPDLNSIILTVEDYSEERDAARQDSVSLIVVDYSEERDAARQDSVSLIVVDYSEERDAARQDSVSLTVVDTVEDRETGRQASRNEIIQKPKIPDSDRENV